MGFGKHKVETYRFVATLDPSYGSWMRGLEHQRRQCELSCVRAASILSVPRCRHAIDADVLAGVCGNHDRRGASMPIPDRIFEIEQIDIDILTLLA